MASLGSLSPSQLRTAVRSGELAFEIGPFRPRVRSDIPAVAEHLARHYADFPLLPAGEMADFQLELSASKGLRRWFRRQVRCRYQFFEPFVPLPLNQAGHTFEWGFNWAIGTQAARFLMFHAATVERDGQAIIMPAYSGSGKSTLCAALVQSGWRLLSDEFALVSLDGNSLYGLGRPISLKNQSIEIIRRHFPSAEIGDVVSGARKGTVGLMVPPKEAVHLGPPVRPRWILAPRYEPEAEPAVMAIERSRMAFYLSGQAFNYQIQGERGFEALCNLVGGCDCLALGYASLEQALDLVEQAIGPGEERKAVSA